MERSNLSMHSIFLKRHFYSFKEENVINSILQLDPYTFYCTTDGKLIHDFEDYVESNADRSGFFQIHFRIFGGKGGFGSLLRSFRVNKSTNQLMCRDLNGRRLASIDEERKLKKWIEKAAEREKEREMKRKAKYAKLKAGDPKHMFDDPEYIQQREDILEKTEDAFEKGLVQYRKNVGSKKVESSSDSDFDIDCLPGNFGRKRKIQTKVKIVEKKKKEVEVQITGDSSESDSDENDADTDLINEIKQYFLNKEGSSETGTSKSTDDMIDTSKDVGISDGQGNNKK